MKEIQSDTHGAATQPAALPLADDMQEQMREKLLGLFGTLEEIVPGEKEITERIFSIAQNFLRAKEVTSGVDLKTLHTKFQDSQIPEGSFDIGGYLNYLTDNVIAHSMRTASPRFIGHMTSALPYFVRALATLTAAMNQNTVKMETSKVITSYERQALGMIHRLIYNFPEDFYIEHTQHSESTLGIVVSGGTLANITALWCARNSSLGATIDFAGVEKEGLHAALNYYGYQGAVVIGSRLMHYSFEKAADVLGIGTNNLVKVDVDDHNRIDLAALRRTVETCRAQNKHIIAIVGVAGATDSGSIDPLSEMADIAGEVGTHFHVDAAWCGPILFSEQHKHKLNGIDRADSVTIDGHKQLYLTMGVGMLMLRDPRLAKVIEKQARYIIRKGSFDLGRRSLEGSRPDRALLLHAALSIIGRRGYEFLIDEGIRKTQYLADIVRARPEFELLIEPEINILNYRYIPSRWREKAAHKQLDRTENELINDFNVRLQRLQRQAGDSFVSRTTLNVHSYGDDVPIVALRAVLANPLTTEADIESVIDEQRRIGDRLEAEKG
ncbi:MAG TPA: putative pyridoxal-dependent aspartate 1-decarboxylase [Pyrinomonadaceae bacterium]|nr:putative pyridoxal-dependent aspartate 1-decarboxylase [Pyrinomonadaceae bacterium]